MISKLLLAQYLHRLECQLEEEMRQPVELQLLNWLEEFIEEVYDEGEQSIDSENLKQYNKGWSQGYKEAKADYQIVND
jgi:hypothetical protein